MNDLACPSCSSTSLIKTGRIGNCVKNEWRPVEIRCESCGEGHWSDDKRVAMHVSRLPYEGADKDSRYKWVDLNEVWGFYLKAAEEIQQFKDSHGVHDGKKLNSGARAHFLGYLGEFVYGDYYGIPVDLSLQLAGKPGADFGDVDIKACTYWKDGYLKQDLKIPQEKWAPKFGLVLINEPDRCGAFSGIATKEEMLRAPLIDWGYGPQYSLHATKLTRL